MLSNTLRNFFKLASIINIYLNIHKYKKLQKFWQYTYMNPNLFILLVQKLETLLIFKNNFSNKKSEIYIEKQFQTILIYENIIFLKTKIDDLYQMEKNTVNKLYYWIITII